MVIKLFDDDGAAAADDLSKIKINTNFAKKYEYNKKREELQRYEELKKHGRVDSSSSDSEDSSSGEEELVNLDKKSDVKFLEALIKVKNQDPLLTNKDAKLFDSDSENEEDGDEDGDKMGKKKEKKPMYLKDVVSKHLIEDGPEFDDDESSDEETEKKVKSYSEEQEEIKREIMNAVNDAEDSDEDNSNFLKVKENGGSEEDDDEDEIGGKLDEFFGEDEKLDNDSKFLKDYFRKRLWIDAGKEGKGSVDDEIEFSEDEDEIEKQEDYERQYNFRYEENAGDRILGHSRKVEGSVRKKDNARKQQRERKEERIAQAEFERKEELKRLKNLKKKEIKEKLQKIHEVAGICNEGSSFLDEDDLEEDFDPDKYDKKMNEAFGDDYYKAEDVDSQFGSDDEEQGGVDMEKPDFSKEDEFLGLSKGWDEMGEPGEGEPGNGFMSIRQKILKDKAVSDDQDEQEEEKLSKRKRKRKPSEVEKAVREELMEEYYKLDYEDTIGDMKTRFKYKKVEPKRYGLTPEEVLMMDDKELSQYVSLKKLAPYREKEWKVPRIKTLQLKQKPKKLVDGESSKKRPRDTGETTITEAENVEGSKPAESRRIKRRKRQAELKLSRSRLMAYGKIPSSKSKSKKQH